MSGGVQKSMFFLSLPDLKKLLCITLTVQVDEEELRSKQIKTCRELVLLYPDILASPALDSFSEITVVMAIPFFHKGILQMFGQRRSLQLGSSQCVFPGVLQCCLSYSLITRLTPSWNKAGLYLITGKDFLNESGRLNAVSMELSTSEGQLCMSIEANAVRLPPTTLQDFDLPPSVLGRFCSDPDFVLDPASIGGAIWCHVLPSMKRGQIINISRQLPRDGPFRTYRDLKNHWNFLYGYRLPELAEEEAVYCSVYFRPVGERLFTYPLSCIRLQPVQRCPGVDLQRALGSFLSDIRDRLQSVCGFPARLSGKPRYHTVSLNTAAAAQVLAVEQVNLTSSSTIRPVLIQLPAPPPPPPPPRPLKPSLRSLSPAWPPLSQQDGTQGLVGNGCVFGGNVTQSQECRRDGDWPSSSSSSCVSFSFPNSSEKERQPAPSLSSSTSPPLLQPTSSLSSFSSYSFPSSVLSPLPPTSQTTLIPPYKLVPIFKSKCPSQQVAVPLLQVQKQKEQLSRGGEERQRVTLPAFKNTSTASPFSSSASLPIPPLLTFPRVIHHPEPQSSAAPPPTVHPKVRHLSSLSPASRFRPGLIPAPKLQIKFKSKSSHKTNMKSSSESSAAANVKVSKKVTEQPSAAPPAPHQPLTSLDTSNKDASTCSTTGVVLKSKLKKSRCAVEDVDVEKMARSNQLSELNTATLLVWLKARGVLVTSKHRKEELMRKVMMCLAEA